MARILYVEDDAALAAGVHRTLESHGLQVDLAANMEEAVALYSAEHVIVLADWTLEGRETGLDFCRWLREKGSPAGVIFVTAVADVPSKLEAFGLGAEDFITKPFDTAELVARIRVLLKRLEMHVTPGSRFPPAPSSVLGMPDIWTLRIGARLVELTSIESKLLTLLFQAHGAPVSRKLLCEAVWKIDASRHWKRLYVHLANLRTKFGSDHEWRLQAVKGGGYRLAHEAEPPKKPE